MRTILILLFLTSSAVAHEPVRQHQVYQGSGVYYNGSSNWSYPGNLRYHMQLHGYHSSWTNTTTRKRLQDWHDYTHNLTQRSTPDRWDGQMAVNAAKAYNSGRRTQPQRQAQRYYQNPVDYQYRQYRQQQYQRL